MAQEMGHYRRDLNPLLRLRIPWSPPWARVQTSLKGLDGQPISLLVVKKVGILPTTANKGTGGHTSQNARLAEGLQQCTHRTRDTFIGSLFSIPTMGCAHLMSVGLGNAGELLKQEWVCMCCCEVSASPEEASESLQILPERKKEVLIDNSEPVGGCTCCLCYGGWWCYFPVWRKSQAHGCCKYWS